MTREEQLILLHSMLDSSDDPDEVLLAYLTIAGQKIINRAFPYRDDIKEVPAKYAYKQVEIACYLLNKRGAEGQTSHDENGVKRVYGDADVPASMLEEIVPFCGVL